MDCQHSETDGAPTRLVGELVALSRMDEEIPFPEKSTLLLSDAAWETAEPFAVAQRQKAKRTARI